MVIDRFHEPGHVACSCVFNMDQYAECCGRTHVDSQVAEQGNSEFAKSDMAASVRHMSQVNFLLSFRFFMFLYNARMFANARATSASGKMKDSLLSWLDVLEQVNGLQK